MEWKIIFDDKKKLNFKNDNYTQEMVVAKILINLKKNFNLLPYIENKTYRLLILKHYYPKYFGKTNYLYDLDTIYTIVTAIKNRTIDNIIHLLKNKKGIKYFTKLFDYHNSLINLEWLFDINNSLLIEKFIKEFVKQRSIMGEYKLLVFLKDNFSKITLKTQQRFLYNAKTESEIFTIIQKLYKKNPLNLIPIITFDKKKYDYKYLEKILNIKFTPKEQTLFIIHNLFISLFDINDNYNKHLFAIKYFKERCSMNEYQYFRMKNRTNKFMDIKFNIKFSVPNEKYTSKRCITLIKDILYCEIFYLTKTQKKMLDKLCCEYNFIEYIKYVPINNTDDNDSSDTVTDSDSISERELIDKDVISESFNDYFA